MNEKKKVLIKSEFSKGSSSTMVSSKLSIGNPSNGIPTASRSALITSIANFSRNENISKMKVRYTKLGDWINVITLLYEKTLEQSILYKKTVEKKAHELKAFYNENRDKRIENLKVSQFTVEAVFGYILGKSRKSPVQTTKIKFFSAKMMRFFFLM